MTIDDKHINKKVWRFTHQIKYVSKITCYEEKMLGCNNKVHTFESVYGIAV